MFTENRYNEIYLEVEDCVNHACESIKAISSSNYILILALGEYYNLLLRHPKLSPYLIDYTIDRYADQKRMKFLAAFLDAYISC